MPDQSIGRLAVVGQGYVGLPVAMRAVEIGFEVVGFDLDKDRVELLRRASTFVDDVSDAQIELALSSGRYVATGDPEELAGFDVAVVCVPTPLRDGAPDVGCIEEAGRMIAQHISPGCCVVLESTTYPGTTEDVLVPILEAGSGLRAGSDFHVGYSPERIDPSNRTWHFENTPKIVSGIDAESLRVVREFYDSLVDRTFAVPGTREAELAKLLENTFRHVNIGLINELAVYTHGLGVDVWSVIDAAATKPFGFMRFEPGPGVGGHCLPIDPSYLSWQVKRSLGQAFRFVDLANAVNDHMPEHVVTRAVECLNARRKAVNGSRVLLIGLAYKSNSGDARNSPAVAVARLLDKLGARLSAIDPLVDPAAVPTYVEMVDCEQEHLDGADLVIVLTDHDVINWDLVAQRSDCVLDTRNRLRAGNAERL
ncbi:nucleotide sugar dehydrogenase [Saccharopolyspora sp. ID03-671]|uniref:nucleotide sugar dehydrogenase n=1 Tax=Saccharopolyspora sp. ID03-671 TaxID=3073066 RepID=UPI0032544E6A